MRSKSLGGVAIMMSIGIVAAMLLILTAGQGWAASTMVKDGSTVQVAGITYRLDGIDAPELDQTCMDEHADSWACGVEARDRLAGLIAGREVRCESLGAGTADKKWRLGVCTAEGDTDPLNQLIVREGFALSVEPSPKKGFKNEEVTAKDNRRGLWKGCFIAPQEFRRGRKDGPLLGEACRADKDREIREVLFPQELQMPPRCSIKGKLAARARVTGHVGVYHLQQCPSYPALTKPDRWFCLEEDAQAAGFRKAFNCRSTGVVKR